MTPKFPLLELIEAVEYSKHHTYATELHREKLEAVKERLEKSSKEFVRGWERGYCNGLAKNAAHRQCCCVFNEDEELVNVCGLHRQWCNNGGVTTPLPPTD